MVQNYAGSACVYVVNAIGLSLRNLTFVTNTGCCIITHLGLHVILATVFLAS